jgi:hypothetical protein
MVWIALQFSFKEVDDYENVYEVSNGPWAVDGIRLGTTLNQCLRKLGQPARSNINAYTAKATKDWKTSTSEVTIIFEKDDGSGKAIEIVGRTLTDHQGKVVISNAMNENDVKSILKSASIKKSYGPGGSGIISCSSVHNSTTFICRDNEGFYSVYFYKGSFSNARASREPIK